MEARRDLQNEVEHRLRLMDSLLPEVGQRLRDMQDGHLGISTKSNPMDLVTEADTAAEAMIVNAVASAFPRDAVLAEERGGSEDLAREAEFAWAIDPVDGTINYAHGLPLYSVSVGILHRGEPVGGIVLNPALHTTYRGVLGRGGTCNGKKLAVTPESQLDRAVVTTGFPYNRKDILPVLLEGVSGILKRARGLRRTGSAALDLCWVAHGRFGALYELNLNAWDSAAGALLVREAGGRITNLIGEPYTPFGRSVVASNGLLHEQLLDMLGGVRDIALRDSLPL